jgi:hypothetical protein
MTRVKCLYLSVPKRAVGKVSSFEPHGRGFIESRKRWKILPQREVLGVLSGNIVQPILPLHTCLGARPEFFSDSLNQDFPGKQTFKRKIIKITRKRQKFAKS